MHNDCYFSFSICIDLRGTLSNHIYCIYLSLRFIMRLLEEARPFGLEQSDSYTLTYYKDLINRLVITIREFYLFLIPVIRLNSTISGSESHKIELFMES